MTQPVYQIVADGTAITEAIADRLLELTITDEAGIESDRLSLTLDDRTRRDGAKAEMPMPGTLLEVQLSYKDRSTWVPMGAYIVDEIALSSPPDTLSLTAKAADMIGPFRAPKTRSWHETTLGELITAIAGEHGYAPRIDPVIAAIEIAHLDQTEESDMSLLTRLSKQYDAVAKPMAGRLVFARRGLAKATSGEALPLVSLDLARFTSWRFHTNARLSAGLSTGVGGLVTIICGLLGIRCGGGGSEDRQGGGGVRAYWWDYRKGQRQEVLVGEEPYETLRQVHASEAEAKAAAATRKNEGKRSEARLSFTLPGDPRLMAEGRISVTLRDKIPSDWRITRAEHRINASGWTTSCDCELYTDELEPVV